MPIKDITIDDKLLQVAKMEFLLHGYEETSVNKICENAKITTGALFRRYKNKKELYLALVMPTFMFMLGLFREHHNVLLSKQSLDCILNGSELGQRNFIDYIYANFDEFKLIIVCSNQKMFTGFLDSFVEIETESMVFMVEKYNPTYFESRAILIETVHIITSAYFNALFEVVRHEMPKEDAYIYIRHIEDFYKTGWLKILDKQ